jgi:hypothetical protein
MTSRSISAITIRDLLDTAAADIVVNPDSNLLTLT